MAKSFTLSFGNIVIKAASNAAPVTKRVIGKGATDDMVAARTQCAALIALENAESGTTEAVDQMWFDALYGLRADYAAHQAWSADYKAEATRDYLACNAEAKADDKATREAVNKRFSRGMERVQKVAKAQGIEAYAAPKADNAEAQRKAEAREAARLALTEAADKAQADKAEAAEALELLTENGGKKRDIQKAQAALQVATATAEAAEAKRPKAKGTQAVKARTAKQAALELSEKTSADNVDLFAWFVDNAARMGALLEFAKHIRACEAQGAVLTQRPDLAATASGIDAATQAALQAAEADKAATLATANALVRNAEAATHAATAEAAEATQRADKAEAQAESAIDTARTVLDSAADAKAANLARLAKGRETAARNRAARKAGIQSANGAHATA